MTNRERIIRKIIGIILLFVGAWILLGSCTPKFICPTYDSAVRAKRQKIDEKKGGETGACVYVEPITKKDKKRSNKLWNSDFCYVKKKKWKP